MAFVVLFAGTAFAEGFALYEFGARGMALGGTLVARKPDASAVAYNPALLTRLPGINVMAGVSTVTPVGEMDTVDDHGNKDTTALKRSTWLIPHAYYTHQINDRFAFGVGQFTRYGLGFEYPHNWAGRFNIYEVALTSVSINPNIAWAATDKLSLAAGIEVLYVDLDLKKRVEVEVPGAFSFEVDSNIQKARDTGLGWNVAMHYQFNDEWAFGFQYRSQVRVHAKGDMQYTMMNLQASSAYAAGLAQNAFNSNFKDGKAHSTVILPDSYSAGISYTPFPELSFELAATYTGWRSFRDLNIHLPDPVGVSQNRKHWKDAWRIGFGIEYSPLDWLTLRAGYTFDESPMPSGPNEDYLVPTEDRDIWSLGVGFHWGSWTVDLAYAHIGARQRVYKADSTTHVLDSRTHRDNTTHTTSLSVSYQF